MSGCQGWGCGEWEMTLNEYRFLGGWGDGNVIELGSEYTFLNKWVTNSSDDEMAVVK